MEVVVVYWNGKRVEKKMKVQTLFNVADNKKKHESTIKWIASAKTGEILVDNT